jgi:hypothetical protein
MKELHHCFLPEYFCNPVLRNDGRTDCPFGVIGVLISALVVKKINHWQTIKEITTKPRKERIPFVFKGVLIGVLVVI